MDREEPGQRKVDADETVDETSPDADAEDPSSTADDSESDTPVEDSTPPKRLPSAPVEVTAMPVIAVPATVETERLAVPPAEGEAVDSVPEGADVTTVDPANGAAIVEQIADHAAVATADAEKVEVPTADVEAVLPADQVVREDPVVDPVIDASAVAEPEQATVASDAEEIEPAPTTVVASADLEPTIEEPVDAAPSPSTQTGPEGEPAADLDASPVSLEARPSAPAPTSATIDGAGTALTEPPPAPVDPAATVIDPMAAADAAELDTPPPAQQIAQALRDVRRLADGSHRLSLQLYPEELGVVQLEVALRDGQLHLRAATELDSTRRLLNASLPELREQLSDAGVSAGSLEVGPETAGGDRSSSQDADRNAGPSRPPEFVGANNGDRLASAQTLISTDPGRLDVQL
ncbi:MAG: flagellar hook-length control protein FliK [Actinomycetota bacterium]